METYFGRTSRPRAQRASVRTDCSPLVAIRPGHSHHVHTQEALLCLPSSWLLLPSHPLRLPSYRHSLGAAHKVLAAHSHPGHLGVRSPLCTLLYHLVGGRTHLGLEGSRLSLCTASLCLSRPWQDQSTGDSTRDQMMGPGFACQVDLGGLPWGCHTDLWAGRRIPALALQAG